MSDYSLVTARQRVVKHPAEEFPLGIDFVHLVDGVAIAQVLVVSAEAIVAVESDDFAIDDAASASIGGTVVSSECRAGSAGADWLVTIVVELADGRIRAAAAYVLIRDR